jgi:hypothetical protein
MRLTSRDRGALEVQPRRVQLSCGSGPVQIEHRCAFLVDLLTRPAGLHGDPYLLETSVPGIFACGDVRASPVKRVAAAVGEGSMAIAFIHQFRPGAGSGGRGEWTERSISANEL